METNMKAPFKINLQLFNDSVETVEGLDSLLGGNTSGTELEVTPEDTEPTVVEEPTTDTDSPDTTGQDGGGQNLESSQTNANDKKDEGSTNEVAAQNAAFARMRTENANQAKALQQIAQALGIEEKDPAKLGGLLVDMAQEKLAKEANIPVELYKELNQTKEQLAAIQYDQNQRHAREKFTTVQEKYGLSQEELMAFARQLDMEGINAVVNPQVDLEYEYYKRNRETLENKRISQAVEEALRNSQAADVQSTTPGKQQGSAAEDTDPAKINNVSALNSLLAERK